MEYRFSQTTLDPFAEERLRSKNMHKPLDIIEKIDTKAIRAKFVELRCLDHFSRSRGEIPVTFHLR